MDMNIIPQGPSDYEVMFDQNIATPTQPANMAEQVDVVAVLTDAETSHVVEQTIPQKAPQTQTRRPAKEVDPAVAMAAIKEQMATRFDFNEVKRCVSIQQYLADRNIPTRGNRFNATWRGGEHFSCAISKDGMTFFDHVDKAGGSVLDLAMKVEGFTTPQRAACELDQRFGLKPMSTRRTDTKKSGRSREVASYTYVDENGTPIYEVVRMEPKEFFQVRLDENGHRVKGKLNGVRRVPYHLPELLAEVRKPQEQQQPIFIAEGEKDADNLRKLGLVATSASMGAGNWQENVYHYSRWFEGARRVLIVADNDPEFDENGKPHYKGQKHAVEVKAALENAGVNAAVAYAEQYKDASDWIAALRAGGEGDVKIKQRFLDLAENTPPWTWTAPADTASSSAAKSKKESAPPRFGTAAPLSEDVIFRTVTGAVEVAGEHYHFSVDASTSTMYEAVSSGVAEVTRQYTEEQMKHRSNDRPLKPLGKNDVESVRQLAVVMWLRSCGQFYRNAETRSFNDLMYFDRRSGRLMRMDSDEFGAWMSNGARMNRADNNFRQLTAFAEDAAMDPDVSPEVVPQAFVARVGDAVYISCGESKMARLKDGSVEIVRNGTDGVLFPCEWTLKKWELLPGDVEVANPFDAAAQFRDLAFGTWFGKYLLRSWYLNLFACHRNRTPLLLAGERNSGKSSVARALREMAGYPAREAGIDPRKEEDFWVAVNGRGLLLFDNVEEEAQDARWLGSAIEKVTTGGGKEVRKLYTQASTTYRPLSDLVFCSKTPHYCENEGVAHRFVIVNLDAAIEKIKGDELQREIASRRDEFMTWTARTVASAVATGVDIPDTVNERYPDFGDFALRCAHVLGDYDMTLKALQCGELEKSRIVLMRDCTASEVYDFLAARGGRWEGTMLDIAQAMHGSEDGERLNRIAMRYAKSVKRLRRPFGACFGSVKIRTLNGRTFYEFGGLNDLLKVNL